MTITSIDVVPIAGKTCVEHGLWLDMTLGGNPVRVAIPSKAEFLAGDPSDQISVVSNIGDVSKSAIFAGLVRIRSHCKENLSAMTPAQIRTNLQGQTGFKI